MTSDHLERCRVIIDTCTAGLSAADAAKRRVPDRWSPVEIVEHLQRAYSGTARGFERCLEGGKPLATGATLKQWVFTTLLVDFGFFPPGRQAPKHVLPKGGMEIDAVVAQARKDLEWLDRSAVRLRERFGPVKVLDHPLLGAFTVDQWLKFHLVHTRHHERHVRERRG